MSTAVEVDRGDIYLSSAPCRKCLTCFGWTGSCAMHGILIAECYIHHTMKVYHTEDRVA